MTILKSIIRTYFLNFAIDAACDEFYKNIFIYPKLRTYPRTMQGLLECAFNGELYTRFGGTIPYEDMKALEVHGFSLSWGYLKDCVVYPERFIKQ